MDQQVVTMLVQIAASEAPAIISAVQNRGGTVQDVGPILDKAEKIIEGDLAQLLGEQTPPAGIPPATTP